MTSSRFLPVSFFTAALFFLSSCGGGGEKTSTEQTTSDSTVTSAPAETVAPSTIITSPQNMVLVKHKVGNYTKWQASYDAHDSMRLANGIHSYVIGRGVVDSNMLLVATKADDITKAKAFTKDPSLKAAMQKGGVTGAPAISFVTMVWQDTSKISADIRSMTTFAVKDWDIWQKAFQEGKQERMDNGIVERAYGYDPDNNKRVTLVTALTDTAKANAYWKSDMLKKRREASGALGVPERFLFRVAKRY